MRGCVVAIVVFLVLVGIVAMLAAVAVPHFMTGDSRLPGNVRTIHTTGLPKQLVHAPEGEPHMVVMHEGVSYARLAALGIALTIPFLLVVLVAAVLRGGKGSARERRQVTESEAREIQDLHHGFENLAGRVEALETILMDRKS